MAETRREKAKRLYNEAHNHGAIIDAFERVLIYEAALIEVDAALVVSNGPAINKVRAIIKAALETRLTI